MWVLIFGINIALLININIDTVYTNLPNTTFRIRGGVVPFDGPGLWNLTGAARTTNWRVRTLLAMGSTDTTNLGDGPHLNRTDRVEDCPGGEYTCISFYLLQGFGNSRVTKEARQNIQDRTHVTLHETPIYHLFLNLTPPAFKFEEKECKMFENLDKWLICVRKVQNEDSVYLQIGIVVLRTD